MEHSNLNSNSMTSIHHHAPAPSNPANDSLYHPTLIQHKVCLPFSEIHDFNNLRGQLMRHVSAQMSGKCIAEGFVKPDSCNIRSHSVGLFAGGNISFNLEIECMLCCPEEGTVMKCVAKTVTQAGIRAHACTEPSPGIGCWIGIGIDGWIGIGCWIGIGIGNDGWIGCEEASYSITRRNWFNSEGGGA